jgi:hypothetical protein
MVDKSKTDNTDDPGGPWGPHTTKHELNLKPEPEPPFDPSQG